MNKKMTCLKKPAITYSIWAPHLPQASNDVSGLVTTESRLVEMMEAFGLVSEAMGSKPRTVLMTNEEFQSKLYSEAEV